ncbi:hypothetical protein C7293_23195 [filamentous cyanobacterium CCT1]|nr:hypothetical protein C7293_23195 [filamentous cyanobacterium CCT1]PSN78555.1 hypothetical protein C8B47_16265 [filamentous cyanobacterium CCP4]
MFVWSAIQQTAMNSKIAFGWLLVEMPSFGTSALLTATATLTAAIFMGIVQLSINRVNRKQEKKFHEERREDAEKMQNLSFEKARKLENEKEQREAKRKLIDELQKSFQENNISPHQLVLLSQSFPESSRKRFQSYIIAIQSCEEAKRLARPNKMAELKNHSNLESCCSIMRDELAKLKREWNLL